MSKSRGMIKQELNLSDQEYNFLEKYQSMKLSQRFGNVFDRLKMISLKQFTLMMGQYSCFIYKVKE